MGFPDRDPSLLAVAAGLLDDNGLVKNFAGVFKGDAVFGQICIALDFVPLEACRREKFEISHLPFKDVYTYVFYSSIQHTLKLCSYCMPL
jgi:hypothetical protein